MEFRILKGILGTNEAIASRNRDQLDRRGILTINIMSSPGAGKTSLVLRAIDRLKQERRVAVIEGDVASSVDADKVSRQGAPVVQINTGGGCHLDANMIENTLDNLSLDGIDLLPHLDFDADAFNRAAIGLNPDVKIFPVSCKTGRGLEAWFSWLENEMKQIKSRQAGK